MPAVVNADVCIACGACAGGCPVEAITVEDVATVDTDTCVECGACVGTCPVESITLE